MLHWLSVRQKPSSLVELRHSTEEFLEIEVPEEFLKSQADCGAYRLVRIPAWLSDCAYRYTRVG